MTDISNEDIALVEDAARKFIKTEVAPHLDDWEEAGEFPRSLYPRAAEMGWLAMGYPEEFGGTPSPWKLRNALTIAMARTGRQNRVPENTDLLSPPDGYSLLQASASCRILMGKQALSLFLQASNLLDASYRDYLNRLRYYADEPGMNLEFKVKLAF